MNVIGDEEETENNEVKGVEEFRDDVIDSPLALQQFLVQPTAEGKFNWITKDMAITYLDEMDLEAVRKLCNLINTLENMGLYESVKIFYGDLASILVSARGRHGFERQMQQTAIQKGFQYFDGEEERKKNILGR